MAVIRRVRASLACAAGPLAASCIAAANAQTPPFEWAPPSESEPASTIEIATEPAIGADSSVGPTLLVPPIDIIDDGPADFEPGAPNGKFVRTGDPRRGEDYILRFGRTENWRVEVGLDVSTRFGQGNDELGSTVRNLEFELDESIDVDLVWLERWLERWLTQRFQIQFSAAREDFEGPDVEPTRVQRVEDTAFRARRTRLTVDSGPSRFSIDLENGASFIGALSAPVTGLRQVLGPSLELSDPQDPFFRPLPIVRPFETQGVTKFIYQYSFRDDPTRGRRLRSTDGFAMSVGLEPFDPPDLGDVDLPIELSAWKTIDLGPTSTRMSGIYSYGDVDGPEADIHSWGVGAVTSAGRWRVGGSYADHNSSLKLDRTQEARGGTFGVERTVGGPDFSTTVAASGAHSRIGTEDYTAYSVGVEQRVRSGMAIRLDVSTFKDERVADDRYGLVVMSEVRLQPRLGSWCTAIGYYSVGRSIC